MPPFLLYAYPDWLPRARRLHIYLAEKKIPSSVVYAIKSDKDAEEKGYPAKPVDAWNPVMGVPTDKPGEYTWVQQSCAMLEFLEDYCDANTGTSPVPSLRGEDLARRFQIRGMMYWADEAFSLFGMSVAYGNRYFYEMRKRAQLNQQVAKEMEASVKLRALRFMEGLGPSVWDYDAIASGKDGTTTIADITLFASWQYAVLIYKKDFAKEFPNLVKLIEAFKNRPSASLQPISPYPPGADKIGDTWLEGLWE